MSLILNSLLLSVSVFARMIIPALLIMVASGIVWTVLGIFTLGLASHISEPVTAAFFSLFGMRVALAVKGDLRRTDFRVLIFYSLMYGLFFAAVLTVLSTIVSVSAMVFALWQLGQPISWTAIQNAAEPVQVAFAFIAVGSHVVVMYVILAVLNAVMAVPMASAAQSAGHRAPSRAFLHGFGQSFIPLFCVFFVSIFLQFYFGVFATAFAFLPVVISVVSVLLTLSLPDFSPEAILMGVASGAALLWLHAWVWSVCALAFLKSEGPDAPRAATVAEDAGAETDIRALRKSRERSF